jgi:hypothetical protein
VIVTGVVALADEDQRDQQVVPDGEELEDRNARRISTASGNPKAACTRYAAA